MPGMCSRRRLAAGAVLAVLAAGCGSPAAGPQVATAGGGGPAADARTPSVDPQDAMLAFTRCLRENGVEVADPNEAGGVVVEDGAGQEVGGADAGTARKAMEKCQELAPPASGHLGQVDPEAQDRLLRFARCMRDNGVDLPDPDDQGKVDLPPVEDGPSNDAVRKANEACRQFFGPATDARP